jgi:hypothetical protein
LERTKAKPIILKWHDEEIQTHVPSKTKALLAQLPTWQVPKHNRKLLTYKNDDFFMEHLNVNPLNHSESRYEKNKKHIMQPQLPKVGNEDLVIYQQNIRGLNISKLDELSISSPLIVLSHIICLSEHQLWLTAVDTILLSGFKLGAKFCRTIIRNGGVCIFVREIINFTNINMEKYCKEKDTEACAVRLHLPAYEIRIIAIYRVPSSNLQQFFQNLDELLYMEI